MPWKHTPETPNIGVLAQTDDIRPGLGWSGLQHLQEFVEHGGVLVAVQNTADLATTFGLTSGVAIRSRRRLTTSSAACSGHASSMTPVPINYGVPDRPLRL